MSNLAFVFPSDELNGRNTDPMFRPQRMSLTAAGFPTSVLGNAWLEDWSNHTVVYRGWMMGAEEYDQFVEKVEKAGGKPLHTREQYHSCHYLPMWYPLIEDLTAQTVLFSADCDGLVDWLRTFQKSGWQGFFIKDWVKSLKTSVGSVVFNPDDAPKVVEEMRKYRGTIEGGLAVRRYENIDPATEKRFFVVDGVPYGPDGADVPPIVFQVAERIKKSRFFSCDVGMRDDGVLRVVELGDGQVSDLTGWTEEQFAAIWKKAKK